MIDVPRETSSRLRLFVELIEQENRSQNLIAASTLPVLWQRHVEDSRQLLDLAEDGRWLDVGTGGGFPGMVIAILREQPIMMVEPRVRRAAFLLAAAETLGLDHAVVVKAKIGQVDAVGARIISARAVAPLIDLLRMTYRHAAADCIWLLPKGRQAEAELEVARSAWQGEFRLVPSRTNPEASIVMVRHLSPRASPKTRR